MTILITDGSQPIGRGVGPALEARDVMAVLRNETHAPQDLKERSIQLAGAILDFDPQLKGHQGMTRARELLETGEALRVMERIMAAQGPPPSAVRLGGLVMDMRAPRSGTVGAIDCFRIARIARFAGAPVAKGAGIDLFKKVGDRVTAGEPLYRIYSQLESDFTFATAMATEANGFNVL